MLQAAEEEISVLNVSGVDLAAVAKSRLRWSSPQGSPAKKRGRLQLQSAYWMSNPHV